MEGFFRLGGVVISIVSDRNHNAPPSQISNVVANAKIPHTISEVQERFTVKSRRSDVLALLTCSDPLFCSFIPTVVLLIYYFLFCILL